MRKSILAFITVLILAMFLSACSIFSSDVDNEGTAESNNASDNDTEVITDDDNVFGEIDPETGITILPEGNGIMFEEEADGAEIHTKKADPMDFVGEWEATSDHATYLYGNFNLTVSSNNSWKANITDEDYSGQWKATEDGIRLTSNRVNFDLAFSQSGELILIEHVGDGIEDYHTVLTRKKIL